MKFWDSDQFLSWLVFQIFSLVEEGMVKWWRMIAEVFIDWIIMWYYCVVVEFEIYFQQVEWWNESAKDLFRTRLEGRTNGKVMKDDSNCKVWLASQCNFNFSNGPTSAGADLQFWNRFLIMQDWCWNQFADFLFI